MQGNKRKLKEIENTIENIDRKVIEILKSTGDSSEPVDRGHLETINDLIRATLNVDLVCDKKKLLKNCAENPNCYHNLGQKGFAADSERYVIENLLRDRTYVDKIAGESIDLDGDGASAEISNQRREKPIGLRNLGATCYFNSLIQVLFMNLEFRKLMIEYDSKSSKNRNEILYQLQRLFFKMQFYKSDQLDPSEFVSTLQIANHQQQDIQEFFILFIDLLESQYHKNSNIIASLFQGLNNYVTICKNCKYKYVNSSNFYELALKTHNCANIKDSFKAYFEAEELTGPDQFYCKNCSRKSDCTRYNEISHLPPYLNLQLIRYVFEKETMSKRKLHEAFRFPLVLNVRDEILNQTASDGRMAGVSAKMSHTVVDDLNTSLESFQIILREELFGLLSQKSQSFQTDISVYQFIHRLMAHFSVTQFGASDSDRDFITELASGYDFVGSSRSEARAKVERIMELLAQYRIVNDPMNESDTSIDEYRSKTKYTCTPGIDLPEGNETALDDDEDYIYELSAILMHRGLYTSSGHYLTHIRDENGVWWQFNDESVKLLDERYLGKEEYSASARRTKKEIDEGVVSSKSAYMVLYSRKNRRQPQVQELKDFRNIPESILEEIRSLHSTYDSDISAYRSKFKSLVTHWENRKVHYEEMETHLPVENDDENYYWISTEWLSNWIQGFEDAPIDNSPLLCTAHHALDPEKLDQMKRVSKDAWDYFYMNFKGGPILDKNSVCKKCLYVLYSSSKDKIETGNLKEHFTALEKTEARDSGFYVTKEWFSEWKKKSNVINNPVSPTYDIVCQHGGLSVSAAQRRAVRSETWAYLKSIYPEDIIVFPVASSKECPKCLKDLEAVKSLADEKREAMKTVKNEMKDFLKYLKTMDNIDFYKPKKRYYVIEIDWLNQFEEVIDKDSKETKVPAIDNMRLLCDEHSLLIINFDELNLNEIDDEDRDFILVSEEIWNQIKKRYKVNGPTLTVLEGKCQSDIEFCRACWFAREEKLLREKLDFKEASLFIHHIKETDNEKDKKYYQPPTGRKVKGYRTELSPVSSDLTVEQLKLLIISVFDIPDYQQNLFINNGTLLSDPKTLRSYNILPNQIIVLKESEDFNSYFEKLDNQKPVETGFKGSIFSSNQSQPQENSKPKTTTTTTSSSSSANPDHPPKPIPQISLVYEGE